MAKADGSNAGLKHITVLEEAHNLLRRTSSEQSQDSSNLQGKSVEMLANAIAEMRTYGEGFIIADQAPGLLDMAVIRNTNTKIIMRLPDQSDRELVGRAANLNDDQITELAKLDTGVTAVYQNHWLEPVLCKVERMSEGAPYHKPDPKETISEEKQAFFQLLLHGGDAGKELKKEQVDSLKNWIGSLDISLAQRENLLSVLEKKALSEEEKGALLYDILNGKELLLPNSQTLNAGLTPDTAQDMVDKQIMDLLHIRLPLAQEIRRLLYSVTADHLAEGGDILRRYGGVL